MLAALKAGVDLIEVHERACALVLVRHRYTGKGDAKRCVGSSSCVVPTSMLEQYVGDIAELAAEAAEVIA